MARTVNFRDSFIKREKLVLFFLMIYLVNPMGYGNYAVFFLFPILLINNSIVANFDKNSILLLAFSLTYVSIVFQYKGQYLVGNIDMLICLVFPVMMYSMGKYYQKKYSKGSSFYKITFIVLFLFSFIAFISIAFDVYLFGFKGNRNIMLLNFDISAERSSTLINAMISPFLALFGTFIIPVSKLEKKYKIIFSLLSFIALIFSIRLGSRTGLAMFITSFVLNYFFFIKYMSKRKKLIYSALFLLFLFVIFNISMTDSDFFYAYQDRLASNVNNTNTAGGRFDLWYNGLKNLLKYPMGIVGIFPQMAYSHNFWLDIARVSGVIPMFFMLLFSLRMLCILYKVVKNRSISLFKRSIILSLNIAFVSVFGVEPILEGDFSFLSVYFFFSGMTFVLYQQSQKKLSNI